MSDYEALMLQSLREEIAFFNAQIQAMVLAVTLISVALYIVAHRAPYQAVARAIPFAIVSGLFAIGRADLLMHRAGAYIRELENARTAGIVGWEMFKAGLSATQLLPVYDLLGLTLWAYLLIWSERQAWDQLTGPVRALYVGGTITLVLAGSVSIVYGAAQR